MLRSSFFLFLISISCIWAKIVDISSFAEMLPYVNKETLLVLDIDDTLLVPKQMLGCDEWFQSRIQQHQVHCLKEHAFHKALAEWEGVRHITDMELVEDSIPHVLSSLQEGGCLMMGLTTQAMTLAVRTNHHLMQHDIELARTAPGNGDRYFHIEGKGVLYRQGILFTSGTHKGESLFCLLEDMGCVPQAIVFVNDKASHLMEVEHSALERGVDFVGLRYGYRDAYKQQFSKEIADIQFAHSSFARILSDEEARRFLDVIKEGS